MNLELGETLGAPEVAEPNPQIYSPERLERLRRAVRARLAST